MEHSIHLSTTDSEHLSNKDRSRARVLVAAFILILSSGILGWMFNLDITPRPNENRKLSTLTRFEWKHPVRWLQSVEKSFNDQFGFRSSLIRLNKLFEYFVLGVSTDTEVLRGKEGWLFYTGEKNLESYRKTRPLSETDLSAWKTRLDPVRAELEARGAQLILFIAPDSHSIYGDLYLPDWAAPLPNAVSRADLLVSFLRSHGYRVVFPREELRKLRMEHPLYLKTDTHWSEHGAFIGYEALINEIRKSDASLPRLKISDFVPVPADFYGGDLLWKLGLDRIIQDRSQTLRWLRPKQAQTTEPNRTNCATCPNGKALVFHDSFMKNLKPYLSETWSEMHYIDSEFIDLQKIQDLRPDWVIHEWVERKI